MYLHQFFLAAVSARTGRICTVGRTKEGLRTPTLVRDLNHKLQTDTRCTSHPVPHAKLSGCYLWSRIKGGAGDERRRDLAPSAGSVAAFFFFRLFVFFPHPVFCFEITATFCFFFFAPLLSDDTPRLTQDSWDVTRTRVNAGKMTVMRKNTASGR